MTLKQLFPNAADVTSEKLTVECPRCHRRFEIESPGAPLAKMFMLGMGLRPDTVPVSEDPCERCETP